ncbi:MAG: hypothetical protein V7731_15095 [Amphritea sp.]
MNKLILILIDGISAELFEQRQSWMPHQQEYMAVLAIENQGENP